MTIFNRRAPWVLLIGDVGAFVASLWIALFLRYIEIPDRETFLEHIAPFSLLFVVWALVFFIFGLYDKQGAIFRSQLLGTLIQVQVANMLIATTFFYFIPWYGISPKTTLFLYLFVSLCLILAWRLYGYFTLVPRSRERAVIIGSGEEMCELVDEVARSKHYNIDFVSSIDLDKVPPHEAADKVSSLGVSLIIADLYNDKVQAILPHLYNLLFSQIRFISMDKIYEDVFDRVPLSLVKHNWFLENVSTAPKVVYGVMKRAMDVIISLVLALVSLIFYPFVAIVIKLDDGGPLFFIQERVGENGRPVRIVKFRSMSAKQEVDVRNDSQARVTRVGAFLRKSRIDELPQLWNVLKGDLSLIGPRPELPTLAGRYEEAIPYYKIRHVIKPGLSGWAQIYHENHPHHGEAIKETREKLSYDLYYVKNRSFFLDVNIALKTIKALVSRTGA
jgi:exopolysaccharide biosynthesis polyprenyl glycosylphosphotransferase